MKNDEHLETATNQVATGCLTARDILKNVFACAGSVTDDELLLQISKVLSATHSFNVAAKLVSNAAGELLQRFWSDFQSLNEIDREDVELAILSKLKQSAKVRRGGRPKGAKGQDTEKQIHLAAALQFLGCSRKGMVAFLKPTHGRKVAAKEAAEQVAKKAAEQTAIEAAKQAVDKLLRRYAVSIKQECETMNEGLAFEIVKANVTIKLAEHILKIQPCNPFHVPRRTAPHELAVCSAVDSDCANGVWIRRQANPNRNQDSTRLVAL